MRSIIKLQWLTYVPGAPEGVVGVLNLRGDVIPVIEFASRNEGEHFLALVLEIEGDVDQFEVALSIDEVLTVTRAELESEEVDDVVRDDARIADVASLDEEPVLVVDVSKLVGDSREVIA